MSPTQPNPKILTIMGPTGAGKTELALALAARRPVDLISVDSVMIYRGMDVGSAKPEPATLERYPHALVDIRDPGEAYSAAQFVEDVEGHVRMAFERNRLPVLVGGTMLYFKAFRDGLADLPAADESIRERLRIRGEREGWPTLHAELGEIDPLAAARIDAHNRQRIERALEVFLVSGLPISDWWQRGASGVSDKVGAELIEVALLPANRATLHRRIEIRFDAMVENGLIEEVRRLRSNGVDPHSNALRSVGYRQVLDMLDGNVDAEKMRSRAIAATRQLAKKQLTWLRRWPRHERFEDPAVALGAILKLL